MKLIPFYRRTYLLAFCVLGMLACKEPCDKVDCGEFGSCSEIQDEPNCICSTGYEKDAEERCTLRSTDKFVGTWTAEEVRTNNLTQVKQTLSYEVSMADEDDNIVRLYVSNIGDFRCPDGSSPALEATVNRSAFSIDEATYCPGAGFSGYQFRRSPGAINATQDTILINYRVTWTEQGTPADFSGSLKLYR
ncbi:MAG: hypothetical protein D6722_25375 [Bacteroidetes bacterium]|nr:MAG: hypothetical protein D6722_25375 [Bacteroidota bacterium]